MTQGERIRELRKTLKMTMEQFGEKIGVTKSTISNIENGNRNATEHMVKSICREFNVDYIWLTTGDGEMFVDTDDDFIERIDRIMMPARIFSRHYLRQATRTSQHFKES